MLNIFSVHKLVHTQYPLHPLVDGEWGDINAGYYKHKYSRIIPKTYKGR